MVDDAASRAVLADAPEHEREAALAVITSLSAMASSDRARIALERVAGTTSVPADVRGDAALLARMMAADEGTESGARADRKLGIVDTLSILGPFRDTGGGLDAHDGPEDVKAFFPSGDRYSWGAYEVAWRAVPREYATATGVPLDLFISPRKESCTWVATSVKVDKAQPLFLRVAATGQVRVVFDGQNVGRDEHLHALAHFDRVAARVEADAGTHLFAAKVCSGAPDDDGRVRLRLTDASGAWPEGVTAGGWTGALRPAKPRVAPLKTALERALEATGEGSPRHDARPEDAEAKLDAGILRTLGGADDLRSPRASGLLVSLVDGGLDPDRLALAAWIAPSGANRSAWLYRVRQGNDAAAHAFADRRFVERHLDAGLTDWAMASLRGAALDRAQDGEAALLSARVELTLGTDALRIRALRRLEQAADTEGEAAPDTLLQSLAQVAAGLDPQRARATWEKIAQRGVPGGDYVRSVGTADSRAVVVAAAKRAFAGGLEDADDALAAAQAVAQSGAHEEARALYEQLARWAPNRSQVWTGLAQEIGATPGDGSREGAIAAALRRARELDPGDARTRAELAMRGRAPALEGEATAASARHGQDLDARDDEKYLVPSQTILARRKGAGSAADVAKTAPGGPSDPAAKASPPAAPPGSAEASGVAAPDVADRELHWLRAVIMHPDRRVSELVHYAREVVIAPRTEDELYEDIPAEGDLTEIVRARVHRKDGSSAFPVEEANENASPRIRWPELSPGDVVEVAFRSWTSGPVGGRGDPPFYRRDYAGALATHPVLYNEVVLEYPPDRPIFFDIVNGKADRRVENDENGRHVVRMVWDNPPNVSDEPLAPPISELIPVLVVSTFKDWGAFRSWYAEAVKGFTEPDAQVRDLAAQLTKGKTTREDKLRALFDFVADDIRYVNYVSAEAWLPNRPQQLLARREGDCDDKAILLITLLRAVGIDAQEVMVQARVDDAQPSVVRAKSAAIPLFNHGIAFLPGPGGGMYLDATSPQSRLGPLPSMDARAPALRMEGPAEIVTLPASSPDDHGVESAWTIQLTEDGGASLSGEERATGDDAFWMRSNLTEVGARPQWVEDHLVGPWFPTVEVDKKVDFVPDVGRGAATAKWKAVSQGLARHEGAEMVVPLSASQTLASQLAPLVKRLLPVWLPTYVAPRKESRTIRVVAPKGWSFEALPQGGDENGGPFGRAHLEVSADPKDKRAVIVKRSVVFDQGTISVDEYPRWRAWVQRVDALMHKALRLEASSKGAASR
jgi:transglutaminase-like putative cysteine protease